MAKESEEVTTTMPHSQDITKVLQYSAEKNEKKWDEIFFELVQALEADGQRANNIIAKELLNVIHQQQNQIICLQIELSALRRENVAASTKLDKIDDKVDMIDGNVELLIDYAKKEEGSNHLALSPTFSPTRSSIGRGRGRGRSHGSDFSQFAGTTSSKFGVIDYFREEQSKYTLNDAPPVIKKQLKKDQVAWIAYQNRFLKSQEGKCFVFDEVYMMH
nr:hypothetical protein Iba_scaffold11018CG0080 [Ipomoea batatas]